MKLLISHFTSIPHGLVRTHTWPAPNVNGFIAQFVWASHRYLEVTGSNPIEDLIFSDITAMILLRLIDFKSAVQYMKYFLYHFTSIPHGLIRTYTWPAPDVSGFIAQLVRASHRYRVFTGSNPWLFLGFYKQLLKLRTWLRWSLLPWKQICVSDSNRTHCINYTCQLKHLSSSQLFFACRTLLTPLFRNSVRSIDFSDFC